MCAAINVALPYLEGEDARSHVPHAPPALPSKRKDITVECPFCLILSLFLSLSFKPLGKA